MPGSDDVSRFVLTYDHLKAWCARQNYEFRANDELGQLAINYALLGQAAPLLILPQLARGMVMLLMRQPYIVPPDRRDAVRVGVNRLNLTSLMGAWAINPDTGEVIFRLTVPSLDIGYTDQGLLHAARIVVGTSEKAAPPLKAIALDGADPDAALHELTSPH